MTVKELRKLLDGHEDDDQVHYYNSHWGSYEPVAEVKRILLVNSSIGWVESFGDCDEKCMGVVIQ